jgi:hypothetical protein
VTVAQPRLTLRPFADAGMTSSSVATVREYLNALPSDRRLVVASVREAILRHLPDGYAESMNWGMISYVIWRIVASTSPAQFIARYELSSRKQR